LNPQVHGIEGDSHRGCLIRAVDATVAIQCQLSTDERIASARVTQIIDQASVNRISIVVWVLMSAKRGRILFYYMYPMSVINDSS
jgi:hypothetical protein